MMREIARDFYRARSVDSAGIDRGVIDRATARVSVGDLTIDALAETIHDQMKAEQRATLEHVARMIKMVEYRWEKNSRQDVRSRNFHQRLCFLESAVRQLKRGS